jgi:hypothetical protein
MTGVSVKTKANGMAAAVLAGLAVLYRYPPELYHFYPQCPVFRYLHMYCPGCGATRALAALLHGRLAEALHYNAYAVLLFPVMCYVLVSMYVRVLRNETFAWPEISPAALKMLLLAGVLFAIFRNTAHLAL